MKTRSFLASFILAAGAVHAATSEPYVETTKVEQLFGIETRYAVWSPDGTKVAFDSNRDGGDQEIYVMDLASGDILRLTDNNLFDGNPDWSPDGERIVFSRAIPENGDREDIFVMGADGSEQTNLTRHPASDSHPKFTADGTRIVFNSNRTSSPEIWAEDFAAGRENNEEVFVMGLDGGNVMRLTEHDDWDTYPQLSPNGRHLVWRRVTATGGKSESGRNSEVFLKVLRTGEETNLTNNQAFDGWPTWSPDGQWIAFASNRHGEVRESWDIYLYHVATKNLVRLTFGGGEQGYYTQPRFHPSEPKLIATRIFEKSADIVVIDLEFVFPEQGAE